MGLGFAFCAYRSPDCTGITGSVRLSVFMFIHSSLLLVSVVPTHGHTTTNDNSQLERKTVSAIEDSFMTHLKLGCP